jgi:hypothetical protein
MKRTVANIGCYSVVVVPIIGSVVRLLGTARGKSVLGIILGISEIKSLLRPAPSAAGRPAVGPEGGVEKASPNEAKTLDEASPKVIVISCNSEPSPSRPPLSRQAGHSPEGASEGRSAPQPSQQFRSAKIRTRTQCVVGVLAEDL